MTRSLLRKLLICLSVISLLSTCSYFRIRPMCCSENLSDADVQEISISADKGSKSDMMRLFLFFEERNMLGDAEKAQYWLQRAADAREPRAEQFMYDQLINSKNLDEQGKALLYLQDAAAQGDTIAQDTLKTDYRIPIALRMAAESSASSVRPIWLQKQNIQK